MNTTTSHHLSRPTDDRILAGVASGLARYVGIDALIVRIGFAVLTLLGGAGIPIYLACWLLIPTEGTGKSIVAGIAADLRGGNLNL